VNPHILRAEVLLAQGRYDLAKREVGHALAESPDDAFVHALLAVCLKGQGKNREAEEAARRAIGLDPGMAYAHFVLSACLAGQRQWAAAEAAVRTAIDLEPSDPDHFHLLAVLRFNQEDWRGALAAAEQGLALDAQHSGCLNARALALTKLGRSDEAARTVEGVLADNPEDAYSHMTRGWTALHQSEPDKALEHFREALRLEPDLEPAREGMVLALKARYRVYRVLLQFFLWMHSRGRRFRWIFVFALLGVQQGMSALARNVPSSRPLTVPVLGLLIAFGAITWLADPLFNLLLRFNRYGRYAVSRDARALALWVGLLLALAAGTAALAAGGWAPHVGYLTAFTFVIFAILACAVYRFAPGRRRLAAVWVAFVLAVVQGVTIWSLYRADIAEEGADAIVRRAKSERAAAEAAGRPPPDERMWVWHIRRLEQEIDDRFALADTLVWVFTAGILGLLVTSQVSGRRRRAG
jgi:tetratricopeptide (TPR) repeat protein